ncbi:MAG: 1-deoxy-D-xylulose-5-phosphate reductoisomerase [Gammaproteobacteria bacterium]|nr:1-deoxy-D-xylulose-5-phosphate reductoisomerase [Gammaproteobacteria bacterium]
MSGIAILGATGTIGVNTLDVIARNPDRFEVVALTAHRNVEKLLAQCLQWRPRYAAMSDHDAAEELVQRIRAAGCDTEVLAGPEALETVAALEEVDQVMAGIVGAAGLMGTLAAARAGKRVLLANKEALVMSGRLLMDAVTNNGAELLPIDSEHNAIFQCLPSQYVTGGELRGVRRVLLTGSGGPFRGLEVDQLHEVTPERACAHPNWVMGPKISVDSATMMNKGLEVIEACWLFNAKPAQIEVVIHPQSVIHSMVEYVDGSVMAQLGHPDMRTPIAHALGWPDRIDAGMPELDFFSLRSLDFEPPSFDRMPCLRLAFEAAEAGSSAPTVLNAANEVAVEAFLQGEIRFTDIARINESVLAQHSVCDVADLETILSVDADARRVANESINTGRRRTA